MDISDATRQAVIIGLGEGGMGGKLLGGLTGLLWPSSGDDVWGSIRGRVEALINQKIQEYEYRNVSDSLAGLKLASDEYVKRVRDFADKPIFISEQYTSTKTAFLTALPHFQSAPSKLLLLPLFAQFANLYLSLLRDGARFGATWGWTPLAVEDEKTELLAAIQNYGTYADTVYQAGLPHPDNPSDRAQWTALNRYMREMTLTVLDHRHSWPFFDVNAGPPTQPTRTIYSDPVGGDEITDGIGFPEPSLQRMTELSVWGNVWLFGMRAAYGGQWADPQSWSDHESTRSQDIGISADAPITAVRLILTLYRNDYRDPFAHKRTACTALYATIAGNPMTLFVGTQPSIGSYEYAALSGDSDDVAIAYDAHVLGSVFVMGGGWGAMVFGFRLANSY